MLRRHRLSPAWAGHEQLDQGLLVLRSHLLIRLAHRRAGLRCALRRERCDQHRGGGADVAFQNVASGSYLLVRAQYVRATGTSATDIVALL